MPSNDEEMDGTQEEINLSCTLKDEVDSQSGKKKKSLETDTKVPKTSPSTVSSPANTLAVNSSGPNADQHPAIYESPVSPLHFPESVVSPYK